MEALMKREPLCRLVRFETTDGVELGGLLYEPARKSKRAVIFLHGTGGSSVYDTRRSNLLAEEFVSRGFAWFPFNNRGAHVNRPLKRRVGKKSVSIPGGSAFERIRDCVADIDGAIAMLRARGYTELYAVGHSTGANKLAIYDNRKKSHVLRKLVFLAGGDDTGSIYQRLGDRRFRIALDKGRQKIVDGEGDQFVPPSVSELPMSWASFVDMADPDGDYNVFPFLEALSGVRLGRKKLFRQLAKVRRPSLYIYGENDQFCYDDVPGCVAVLTNALEGKDDVELRIIREADHGFAGFEPELSALISAWLRRPMRHGSSARPASRGRSGSGS
jgi:pimeloyl-ACP methyl ester carboxylesterase